MNNMSRYFVPFRFIIPKSLIRYIDIGVGNDLASKICQYITRTDFGTAYIYHQVPMNKKKMDSLPLKT